MKSDKDTYRKSKIYEEVGDENNDVALQNILLTYKKIRITKGVKKVLKYFESPKTIESCLNHFNKVYDLKEMEKTLSFLVKKRIIIKSDEIDTFLVANTVYSLFGVSKKDFMDVEDSLVFVGIPFGKGNSLDSKTSKFPDFFRNYINSYKLKIQRKINKNVFKSVDNIDNIKSKKICDIGNLYIYRNEKTSSSYNKIEILAEKLAKKGNTPIFLGGDHSITYPILAGISRSFSEIQLIHLDAHTDTYSSKLDSIYQDAGMATHHHGDYITKVVENIPNIVKILQIGIRGLPNIYDLKPHDKIDVLYNKDFSNKTLSNKLNNLGKNIPTYITLDIDFFDPSIAPATVTPVINGASCNNYIQIINELEKRNINIIGMDIVEVNVKKDVADITSQLVTELLLYTINSVF